MKKKLTQERLKELLHYDPDTGVWTHNVKYISRNRLSNRYKKIAGYISKTTGYRYLGIGDMAYLSSRLSFLYVVGYIPEQQVDHINRIRHDDRWVNLRHVTPSCNMRNAGIYSTNTTGITGVYWHKTAKKWVASITNNGKRINFNKLRTFEEAVRCRWEAEKKYGYSNCNSSSPSFLYLKNNGLI